ncbi:MAG: HWE histidine kinase domain-containing protein [Amaricoccus sp.]|uniref:sensor histidine kinase n=1 Tax=Amaricoccus sp. TaxID=1872485 RepID=UPI0039E46305
MTSAELARAFVGLSALAFAASLAHPRGRQGLAAASVPIAGISTAAALALLTRPMLPAAACAALVSAAALALWGRTLWRLPDLRDFETARRETELSERRFREALSRSNISVFAQDTDLRYTWVYNPRVGVAGEALLGRRAGEVVAPDLLDEADALKLKAIEAGQMVNDTVALHTTGDGRLYFDMTVAPTFDAAGRVDGILCSAFDVTEMRLFEVRLTAMAAQLAAAYQRFELALDNSPITVFEQGADLRYTFVYNPPPGLATGDFLDRTDADIFSERDARRLAGPKERVLASGGRESVEVEVDVEGSLRYYELTVEAKRDSAGAVVGLVGTTLDLTERRRDEQRIRLMLRELTHRSKNLLAVIQAMARKTASLSGDLDSFVSDFSLRLRAIAAAHDLLVSQSWHGADLRDLLVASLGPTIEAHSPQVTLRGEPTMLTPDAAQNLGLAFHELATNASKYGALSVPGGHLHVDWMRLPGEVQILWSESGGPAVAQPERQGFGRVLLERLVGVTLGGSVRLDFRPEGLVCQIRFADGGMTSPPDPALETAHPS